MTFKKVRLKTEDGKEKMLTINVEQVIALDEEKPAVMLADGKWYYMNFTNFEKINSCC